MRYKTELMEAILTNKKAQEIIDYVSPIYGEAYVGLWLFQVIGAALDEVCDIAAALRYDSIPSTTDLLLPLWEDHYGLPRDDSLTKEQRRRRLTAYISASGPCNPSVLSEAVSVVLGGAEVDITENVAKNTFRVNVRDPVKDYKPAMAELSRRKPAHLIYEIRAHAEATADIKIGVAVTHAEQFHVDVLQCFTFKHEVPANMTTAIAITQEEKYKVEVLQCLPVVHEVGPADITTAIAITHAEKFTVEVLE